MTPEEEKGFIKRLRLEEIVFRKLRVMMPDPDKLQPELLTLMASGKLVGYVLEIEVLPTAEFVGTVNIPTVLDILGGNVGGPVAYAFLEPRSVASQLAVPKKRWYMEVAPGIDWGLPPDIRPEVRGISAIGGVLHGHFELVLKDEVAEEAMNDYLDLLANAGVITMPAKDYVVPKSVMDALNLARKNVTG